MSSLDDLPEPERDLARSLRASLRAGEAVDYVTAAQLRAARARALASAQPAPRGWLYASGGLTAAALVAAVIVLRAPHATLPLATDAVATQADAIEVMTDDLDADFYEDLELYRWLDWSRDGSA